MGDSNLVTMFVLQVRFMGSNPIPSILVFIGFMLFMVLSDKRQVAEWTIAVDC